MGIFGMVRASTPPPQNWQLSAGRFSAADMPMELVYPRPDTETSAYEYGRLYPSNVPLEIPIGIQGGTALFHYEIVDDDGLGATIGADWSDSDWGLFKCADPAIGSYSIHILATDQDLSTVDIQFTLNIQDRESTTYFIWLDGTNGNNSNSGSFSSPKQSINGWYLSSATDSTHANKQIWYREGTYTLGDTGVPLSDGYKVLFRNAKPKVHVGYPGETVTIDFGDQNVAMHDGGGGGAFTGPQWVNINHINPLQTLESNRKQFHRIDINRKSRSLYFRTRFDGGVDVGAGAASSNHSCVMFQTSTNVEGYALVSHVTFHNCDDMDTILSYAMRYLVVQHFEHTGTYREVTSGKGGWGVFHKGREHDHCTTKFGTAIGAQILRPIYHMSEFTGHLKTHLEVRYLNVTALHTHLEHRGAVQLGEGGSGISNAYGPFFCRRCNFYVDRMDMVALEDGPFTFSENAIQCHADVLATEGINEMDNAQATMNYLGLNLVASSGLLDGTTNLLTGAARAANLGLFGSEISP